eukprot:COSAG06_NODE_5116_length_3711_cov_2.390642_2_plen_83_part_00
MAKDAGAKTGQINRCLNHKSNQKEAFIALLTKLLDANKDGKVKGKRVFFAPFYTERLFSPRQARDKHRKTQDKDAFSLGLAR